MPEARMRDRNVPGASSLCNGTDKLAISPLFNNTTWLPIADPYAIRHSQTL
jgi:hypothetical protein